MHAPFFPDPVFGWLYIATLLALLAAASYTDLGRMVVPKGVTLTALALGLLFSLVRGAWLGMGGTAVWKLGAGGGWVGAADGLLFALAGFALGFTLFFLMWILGTCGGGDVKLFGALGAWVGPFLALGVFAMTLVVVTGVVLARMVLRLVRGDWKSFRSDISRKTPSALARNNRLPRRRVLAFSLPLAIATTVVLLWVFRVELQVVPASTMATARIGSHAP
jgi:Flp pilus assembly protein protease CpaA